MRRFGDRDKLRAALRDTAGDQGWTAIVRDVVDRPSLVAYPAFQRVADRSPEMPTAESRDAVRATNRARFGFDGMIPERTADRIRDLLAVEFVITGESWRGTVLEFSLAVDLATLASRKADRRRLLDFLRSTYGNAPHNCATDLDDNRARFQLMP